MIRSPKYILPSYNHEYIKLTCRYQVPSLLNQYNANGNYAENNIVHISSPNNNNNNNCFKRKASFASRVRVFVELCCCSISSHKYSGAVRSIKALKVKINSLYTILSSIPNQCRSIRTSVI